MTEGAEEQNSNEKQNDLVSEPDFIDDDLHS